MPPKTQPIKEITLEYNHAVVEKAKILVGFYKAGLTKAFEVPFAIGGEVDSMVKIQTADTGTNQGEKGVCEYDVCTQLSLFGILDDENGVVIIAPYENKYHIFVAEYDPAIDLHLPLYFLGLVEA